MAGTRDNSIINDTTVLYYQFLKSGLPFSAYEVEKVEIYDNYTDAYNATGAIQTVLPADIIEPSTGKYRYVMNASATTGTFFDRIFLIPESGQSTWNPSNSAHINAIYIRTDDASGFLPGPHERVRVFLNIFDITDNPLRGNSVQLRMNAKFAWYGNDFIKQETETLYVNSEGQVLGSDGQVGMNLIETDTLTADTNIRTGDNIQIYYEINITGKKWEKFFVPAGLGTANWKHLPKLED
jgi:hypothetical protein